VLETPDRYLPQRTGLDQRAMTEAIPITQTLSGITPSPVHSTNDGECTCPIYLDAHLLRASIAIEELHAPARLPGTDA
jgi:hypothetical protein